MSDEQSSKVLPIKSDVLFTETDYAVIAELYQLLRYLGCNYDILSVIGSWKDTLPDSDVLLMLHKINTGLRVDLEERLKL